MMHCIIRHPKRSVAYFFYYTLNSNITLRFVNNWLIMEILTLLVITSPLHSEVCST